MSSLTFDEVLGKYTHKPVTLDNVSFYDEQHRAYMAVTVNDVTIHMCLMPNIEALVSVADSDDVVSKLTFSGKTEADKNAIKALTPSDFDDIFTIYMDIFEKLNGEKLGK